MTTPMYRNCECGNRYNAARFARCYNCNQRLRNRRRNGCVECGEVGCNGLCLDIAIERWRGVRDD